MDLDAKADDSRAQGVQALALIFSLSGIHSAFRFDVSFRRSGIDSTLRLF